MAQRNLGRIILLRTENARVRHTQLAAWFTELKLDQEYLPSPPRPVDAFKKATNSGEKLTYAAPWVAEGAQATVVWRDDSVDTERIVRRAERTITVKRKTTEPTTIATVTFYKRSRKAPQTGVGGEKLRFAPARDRLQHANEERALMQWMTDTNRRYLMWLEWVDTDALRGVVRNYITRRLHGLMVRPGVYFVFDTHDEENAALSTLVDRFGDECMYHPIELQDTEPHRKMLAAALINHAEADAVGMERELQAIIRRYPRSVPREKAMPVLDRYEALMNMLQDYGHLGVVDGAPAVDRLTELVVTVKPAIA